jgi:hypothetical protein
MLRLMSMDIRWLRSISLTTLKLCVEEDFVALVKHQNSNTMF